jgi:hypothetical protein
MIGETAQGRDHLLLAVPGRNQEPQPALVRDGKLRQSSQGAAPPRKGSSSPALTRLRSTCVQSG